MVVATSTPTVSLALGTRSSGELLAHGAEDPELREFLRQPRISCSVRVWRSLAPYLRSSSNRSPSPNKAHCRSRSRSLVTASRDGTSPANRSSA
jgi:hypothetical protein